MLKNYKDRLTMRVGLILLAIKVLLVKMAQNPWLTHNQALSKKLSTSKNPPWRNLFIKHSYLQNKPTTQTILTHSKTFSNFHKSNSLDNLSSFNIFWLGVFSKR